MGAVLATDAIYQAFMQGPEQSIELFHGYTYSGHPVAAAAGLATLDVYRKRVVSTKLGSWRQCLPRPFISLMITPW